MATPLLVLKWLVLESPLAPLMSRSVGREGEMVEGERRWERERERVRREKEDENGERLRRKVKKR